MSRSFVTALSCVVVSGVLFTAGCATKKTPINPNPAPAAAATTPAPERQPTPDANGFSQSALRSSSNPAPAAKAPLTQADVEAHLKTIHFAFDSAALSPEAKQQLEQDAGWLKQHPNTRVQIQGNCDERGTVEFNLALGAERARAVRAALVDDGVDARQLDVISFGKEHPVDPGHNEGAWAKNRRDDFRLITS